MNLLKSTLLIWALAFTAGALAQREAANWYFGRNAGLQFKGDGNVIPLLNGALSTNEGCASISDKFGNLLFYTDGITVWDRTHNIMTNGTGLLGDPSSTQSAIIVPKPEDTNIYYIFTVHALGGDVHDTSLLRGLNYYEVDMSAGTHGAITGQGNNEQPLLIPNSEKITAVRSADCSSIWVISHFLDTFYAFEVSSTGVNANPVTSVTPTLIPLGGYRYNAIGYLKASPDGSKVAVAHSTVSPVTNRSAPGKLLIYDFDAATGVVSNEKELNIDNRSPYGVEFSPNSELLYATAEFYNSNSIYEDGKLFQFDLSATNIDASKIQLGTSVNGALQLAPNGKIYSSAVTRETLNVINAPNEKGTACNFVEAQQTLGGRIASFGLPPFIQSLFNEVVNIIGPEGENGNTGLVLCENDSFTFNAPVINGASYQWTFEDLNNNSVLLSTAGPSFSLTNARLNDSGVYKLEIDRNDGSCPIEGYAFVTVNALPLAIKANLTQCDIDVSNPADGFTLFNLKQATALITNSSAINNIAFYESLNDIQNNNPINTPESYRNTTAFNQTIYAKVTGLNGCTAIAELDLTVQSTIVPDTNIKTYYACDSSPEDLVEDAIFDLEAIRNTYAPLEASFYRNRTDATLEVNGLNGTLRTPSTRIFVRLELSGQCQGVEQLALVIDPLPEVNFPDEIVLCLNKIPEIEIAEGGFDQYRWYKINATNEIEVSHLQTVSLTEPGRYRLELTTFYTDGSVPRSCSNSKQFEVKASNIATINQIEIRDFVADNRITIYATGEGNYEYALNDANGPYQDSNIFKNIPPGKNIVYVRDKNNCGILNREIYVLGYPKFFTPNGDGYNDLWQITGRHPDFFSNSKIYIFDRYGKTIKVLRLDDKGWDGIFNGVQLPSSDYWFRVFLEDGRVFTGHFALKR